MTSASFHRFWLRLLLPLINKHAEPSLQRCLSQAIITPPDSTAATSISSLIFLLAGRLNGKQAALFSTDSQSMSPPGILVFKRGTFPSEEVVSAFCLLPPSNTHHLPSPPTSSPPPQTVSTASELRKPIYWIVAAKAIDYEQMLLLMAGVKWDIREIMSQHNVYVDVLLKVILVQEGSR